MTIDPATVLYLSGADDKEIYQYPYVPFCENSLFRFCHICPTLDERINRWAVHFL